MSEELKACPFCGGKAEWKEDDGWIWLECSECGIRGKRAMSNDSARYYWNRRTP